MPDGETTVTQHRIVFAEPWGAGEPEISLGYATELAKSCVAAWPEMGPARIERRTVTTTDWEDCTDGD